MQSDDLVLGVDGGGTKTVAWLAPRAEREQATIVGRGSAGPANIQAVGPEAAIRNLNTAVDAAMAESEATPGPVASAVVALAGSDRRETRQRVEDWAKRRRLAHRLKIVHDALPVLAAGCSDGWGLALVCGTGSLCFGQTADGRSARAGGWGYLFGDEGSAYAIAVAGLRAAAKAADGRGPKTRLLPAILARLGLRQPEELVSSIYSIASERARLASLAEEVTTAAVGGDVVAMEILDKAAQELGGMVSAVASQLNLASKPYPLALSGGLLLGAEVLCSRLLAWLRAHQLGPASCSRVTQPVLGAIKLAQAELTRKAPRKE